MLVVREVRWQDESANALDSSSALRLAANLNFIGQSCHLQAFVEERMVGAVNPEDSALKFTREGPNI